MDKVHIIGAGISGFGCANFLKQKNITTELYEKTQRVGGRAATVSHNGYEFEVGGKNFSSNWVLFNKLLIDNGITEFDDQHSKFHILMGGSLMMLDKKSTLSSGFGLIKGIGIRGALQFNHLLKDSKKSKSIFSVGGKDLQELESKLDTKTIDKLYSRKLAYGPLRMFSIIMAGAEPEEMYRSTLMKFLSGFGNGSHHAVRGGLGRLFKALSDEHQVNYGIDVKKINVSDNKVSSIDVIEGKEFINKPIDNVILAVPLHKIPSILDMPEELVNQINKINYFPLILVNAVYDQDVFNDDIMSIMFDDSYHLGHCSANRLYEKNHVRFTFSGKNARNLMNLNDTDLLALAKEEFSKVHPINGKLIEFHVARHKDGLCGYSSKYSQFKERLLQYINTIEGLEVAGDFLEGHAMGDCLISSHNAVERLLNSRVL